MLAMLMLGLLLAPTDPPAAEPPNILVLVLDDLGLEVLQAFDAENIYPPGIAEEFPLVYPQTPAIDRLAANGVRFTQTRVAPTCSATRATLLSGRYPFRHGIGALIRRSDATPEYSRSRTIEFGVGPQNPEWTVAHLARQAGYSSFLCGKWHLALQSSNLGVGGQPGTGWNHIREVGGFEDYWAVWANLPGSPRPEPWTNSEGRLFRPGYYNFIAGENGEVENVRGEYATTVQVDKMLEYVDAHTAAPWLVVSPFSACHTPHQLPPPELVQTEEYLQRAKTEVQAMRKNPSHQYSTWGFYMAMVEALDHEIGRLVDGLEERELLDQTVIILIADNGTPQFVMRHAIEREGLDLGQDIRRLLVPNREHYKHTVWEPGVRVPLIVSGPVVAEGGRSSAALVDGTDVFETIRELLGVARSSVVPEEHALDGVSFLGLLRSPQAEQEHARKFSLVEHFEPTGNPERIVFEQGKMSSKYLRRRGFVLQLPGGTYKLVRNQDHLSNGRDQLFQLAGPEGEPVDPFELSPLRYGPKNEQNSEVHQQLAGALDALLRTEARNWR